MGYTHYWTMHPKASREAVKKMVIFTREAIKQFGEDKLAGPCGEINTSPDVTAKCISFNGIGEDSHETASFIFNSPVEEYCKTNRKPYDAMVVACIRYAKDVGVITRWSSDGKSQDGDFDKGLKLYFEVLRILNSVNT